MNESTYEEKRKADAALWGDEFAQLKASDWFALLPLKIFRWINQRLINCKLLHNMDVILYTRKI